MSWQGPYVSLVSAAGVRINATATSTVIGEGQHLSDLPDNADSVQLGEPLAGPGIRNIDVSAPGVGGGFDPMADIRLDAEMPFQGTWLRMFHVNYQDLSEVIGEGFACSVPSRYAAENPATLQLISFVDSNEHLTFVFDPASPYPQLGFTEVPSQREGPGWRVDYITDIATTLGRVRGIPSLEARRSTQYTGLAYADFVVFYKDPHVVAVPSGLGGGWLMILARARVLREAAEDEAIANPDIADDDVIGGARSLESVAGGPVISDVVAYYCESQMFRGDTLKGPYLLVDSLRAVGTQNGTVRAWCGAPTGAFLQTGGALPDLYLYYSAAPYVEGRVFPGDSEEDIGDMNSALGFLDDGIGHIRIPGEVVQEALAAHTPPAEAEWAVDHAWAEPPGTIGLNLVRPWMATDSNARPRSLETKGERLGMRLDEAIADAIFAAGRGTNRDLINPFYADAVVMNAGGRLVLVVGVSETRYAEGVDGNEDLSPAGDTLLGLWRMAAVEAGVELPAGDIPTAEHGIDYVVSYGETDSPDLVARAYIDKGGAHHNWLDADPVAFSVLWFVFGRDQFGVDPVLSEHVFFLTGESVFDDPVLS